MVNAPTGEARLGQTEQVQALDRDCTTLSRHVLQQLHSFSADAQDLSALMSRIGLAAKLIARRLSRAGLMEDALGFTGAVNVQGEIGRYSLLYDPIDGSSNLDINLNVGSIFSIRKQEGDDEDGSAADLLQHGHKQIAAGYVLYGPSTMLVYSIGQGVHSFTLDPSLGEFILSTENIKIPDNGPIYSVNEGSFWQWEESYRDYIRYVHRNQGYTARYGGALVGDFHRILFQGGVFLYPGTVKNPDGKLRLLYESAPLAFLMEQAGGRASTGIQDILDVVPTKIHERTPLIIGSKENVALVESFIKERSRNPITLSE
ncbi:MAG: fructose-1,6-bisphosphatase [Oscillatoriales cyanobacterium]|nr:MAG: fructose-1,6-bisphosphatase [Oscillatoriales cyanobacterium]